MGPFSQYWVGKLNAHFLSSLSPLVRKWLEPLKGRPRLRNHDLESLYTYAALGLGWSHRLRYQTVPRAVTTSLQAFASEHQWCLDFPALSPENVLSLRHCFCYGGCFNKGQALYEVRGAASLTILVEAVAIACIYRQLRQLLEHSVIYYLIWIYSFPTHIYRWPLSICSQSFSFASHSLQPHCESYTEIEILLSSTHNSYTVKLATIQIQVVLAVFLLCLYLEI